MWVDKNAVLTQYTTTPFAITPLEKKIEFRLLKISVIVNHLTKVWIQSERV